MNFVKKNFIVIAGVHKGASTSLYEYFIMHPEVCGGKKKEIHYFTPLRYGNKIKDIEQYEQQFEQCMEKKYLIDASPSYLYGKKLIAHKINDDLENVKVIIILRNPVERFISFYKSLKASFRINRNEDFSNFLNQSYLLKDDEDKDDVYYRAFREGCYANYLKEWFDVYKKDSIRIIFFDDLKNDPQKTMKNLIDWIGIDGSIYDDVSIFTVTNKTQPSKNRYLYKMASYINMTFERFWRRHKRLKNFFKSLYFNINGQERAEVIGKEDIKLLNNYYKEYNQDLYKLLKKYKYEKLPSWLTQL